MHGKVHLTFFNTLHNINTFFNARHEHCGVLQYSAGIFLLWYMCISQLTLQGIHKDSCAVIMVQEHFRSALRHINKSDWLVSGLSAPLFISEWNRNCTGLPPIDIRNAAVFHIKNCCKFLPGVTCCMGCKQFTFLSVHMRWSHHTSRACRDNNSPTLSQARGGDGQKDSSILLQLSCSLCLCCLSQIRQSRELITHN